MCVSVAVKVINTPVNIFYGFQALCHARMAFENARKSLIFLGPMMPFVIFKHCDSLAKQTKILEIFMIYFHSVVFCLSKELQFTTLRGMTYLLFEIPLMQAKGLLSLLSKVTRGR